MFDIEPGADKPNIGELAAMLSAAGIDVSVCQDRFTVHLTHDGVRVPIVEDVRPSRNVKQLHFRANPMQRRSVQRITGVLMNQAYCDEIHDIAYVATQKNGAIVYGYAPSGDDYAERLATGVDLLKQAIVIEQLKRLSRD